MPSATDLRELKIYLEIDPNNHNEDKVLSLLIDHASSWIEELLGRKIFYQSRTEYYNGTGTQKLLLKVRPVFTTPTIQVYVDSAGYFGSASGAFDSSTTALTYGTDFCLQVDQDNGTSRSGILIRINNYWQKRPMREVGYLSPYVGPSFGSIKIVYTAGWTIDSMPGAFRMAVNLLVARMRYILPLGLELNSESYEERSISIVTSEKDKLITLVKPIIMPFRNWKW